MLSCNRNMSEMYPVPRAQTESPPLCMDSGRASSRRARGCRSWAWRTIRSTSRTLDVLLKSIGPGVLGMREDVHKLG